MSNTLTAEQVVLFNTKPPVGADVRAYFQGDTEALASLSEDAQATVVKGARGRIHPEARDKFNEGKRPSEQYTEGTPRTVASRSRAAASSTSRSARTRRACWRARPLASVARSPRQPARPLARPWAACSTPERPVWRVVPA
jgi:hypothetical protein